MYSAGQLLDFSPFGIDAEASADGTLTLQGELHNLAVAPYTFSRQPVTFSKLPDGSFSLHAPSGRVRFAIQDGELRAEFFPLQLPAEVVNRPAPLRYYGLNWRLILPTAPVEPPNQPPPPFLSLDSHLTLYSDFTLSIDAGFPIGRKKNELQHIQVKNETLSLCTHPDSVQFIIYECNGQTMILRRFPEYILSATEQGWWMATASTYDTNTRPKLVTGLDGFIARFSKPGAGCALVTFAWIAATGLSLLFGLIPLLAPAIVLFFFYFAYRVVAITWFPKTHVAINDPWLRYMPNDLLSRYIGST